MYPLGSVVDRHRFYADPDPDLHFDVDSYPDPDWNQNDADSHTDPIPSFTHVRKSGEKKFIYIHSSACLHRFILLANVVD
jgi:hypothetical protein